MEGDTPRVALLGGQELDDIRAQLGRMRLAHLDAGEFAADAWVPLLLSTAQAARLLAEGGVGVPPHACHVAVCEAPLEGPPADLCLVRPLPDEVLRQLARRRDLEHCDRRLATRIPMGVPVEVSAAGARHPATLDRISIHGCGMFCEAALADDEPVKIALPRALTGPRGLSLRGRIRSRHRTDRGRAVIVSFEPLDLCDRVTLRALMARHGAGSRPAGGVPARVATALRGRVRGPFEARDAGARRSFRRSVVAACGGQGMVLMGRELSAEGLRVEHHALLSTGDLLRIVLFDAGDAPPLLLEADLCGDDGEGGLLRFAGAPETERERLEAMLGRLVPVELAAG